MPDFSESTTSTSSCRKPQQLGLLEWGGIKQVAQIVDARPRFRDVRGRWIRRLLRENRVPVLSGGPDPIDMEAYRSRIEVARNLAKAAARKAKRVARERAKARGTLPDDQPPRRA